MQFETLESREQRERMQKAADRGARERRERSEAMEREWADATRRFTEDEAREKLASVAARLVAGELDQAQHDNIVRSVESRTERKVTLGDHIANELKAMTDPIGSLTPAQRDRLWNVGR
jgi:hypothetical protein